VLGIVALLGVHYSGRFADRPQPQPKSPNASFVGSGACLSCHPAQSAEWGRSMS
jgi:hypothetical protein